MNWIKINELKQLEHIREQSNDGAVLIFKHSTRCSVSNTALDRLERNWNTEEMKHVTPYFLDLISYREISNQIEQQFEIAHESPQLLLIKNGKVVHDWSHFDISYATMQKSV